MRRNPKLGTIPKTHMSIKWTNNIPIYRKTYPIPHRMLDTVRIEMSKL